MATSKNSKPSTTKLTHINGATVAVDSEKADRLVAGGNFTKPTSRTAKSD